MEVRKFHNDVKSCLLNEYTKKFARCNILDLACGRGGDIHKWMKCKNINNVLAIDNDYESITEANNRLSNIKNLNTNIDFLHSDISSKIISSKIINYKKKIFGNKYYYNFDIITCFFAIQYFFENNEEIKNMIQLIDNNLKPGGYFIGIAPNEQNILNLISQDNNKKTYDSENLKISVIGNKCNFWVNLGNNSYFEQFGESHEYLVNIPHLKDLCKEKGLECIRCQDFEEIGIPENIIGDHKNFSKLYTSWVFYKPIQTIYFPSRPSPFKIYNVKIDKSDMPMITKPHETLGIIKAIRKFNSDLILSTLNIVDATSGVGGDTINFSTFFNHVISIEQNPERFKRLCHNVELYNLPNVTTINSDCVQEFTKYNLKGNIMKCHILYIDAPWFIKNKNEIALSNWDIMTITQTVLEGGLFPLVILKLPFNHNNNLPLPYKTTRFEITRKMCIKFITLN